MTSYQSSYYWPVEAQLAWAKAHRWVAELSAHERSTNRWVREERKRLYNIWHVPKGLDDQNRSTYDLEDVAHVVSLPWLGPVRRPGDRD